MQPQYRSSRRRLSWIVWLIPAVLVCCLAVFLLAPAVPGLVLRIAGFAPRGSVETFWETQTVQMTPFEVVAFPPAPPIAGQAADPQAGPTATPVVLGGQGGGTVASTAVPVSGDPGYGGWFQAYSVPPSFTLSSPSGSFSVNTAEARVDRAWFGSGVDGFPLGIIEYGEAALPVICETWLRGCATDQFTVYGVDFRPNGLIVYGMVTAGGLNQSIGLVLTLGGDMKSLVAQGIVIGGQLYAVPTSGDIATYISQVVTQSNQTLGQLRVQAGGYSLGLVQIRMTDSSLALIFR